MKRRITLMIAAVATVLVLGACGGKKTEGAGSDNAGGQESVQISGGQVETVVAVSRDAGEIWLLAGGKIQGITEDGRGLSGIGDDVTYVGTTERPNFEAILFLEPDLVILSDENEAYQSLKQQLDQVSKRNMTVGIDDFEDYDKTVLEMTQITGREDLYEKNVIAVREEMEAYYEQNPDAKWDDAFRYLKGLL